MGNRTENKVANLLIVLFFVLVMLTTFMTLKNYVIDSKLQNQINHNKQSITELEKSLDNINKEKNQMPEQIP